MSTLWPLPLLLIGLAAPAQAAPWLAELTPPPPERFAGVDIDSIRVRLAAPGQAFDGEASVRFDDGALSIQLRHRHLDQRIGLDYSARGLETEDTAPHWKDNHSRILLLAIAFLQLDPKEWLEGEKDWHWQPQEEGRFHLLYRDELRLKLDYADPPIPGRAHRLSLAGSGVAIHLERNGEQ